MTVPNRRGRTLATCRPLRVCPHPLLEGCVRGALQERRQHENDHAGRQSDSLPVKGRCRLGAREAAPKTQFAMGMEMWSHVVRQLHALEPPGEEVRVERMLTHFQNAIRAGRLTWLRRSA
jgi:hypothetical protein